MVKYMLKICLMALVLGCVSESFAQDEEEQKRGSDHAQQKRIIQNPHRIVCHRNHGMHRFDRIRQQRLRVHKDYMFAMRIIHALKPGITGIPFGVVPGRIVVLQAIDGAAHEGGIGRKNDVMVMEKQAAEGEQQQQQKWEPAILRHAAGNLTKKTLPECPEKNACKIRIREIVFF